jgi:hypothetical protein
VTVSNQAINAGTVIYVFDTGASPASGSVTSKTPASGSTTGSFIISGTNLHTYAWWAFEP